jgi:hypothetical protein
VVSELADQPEGVTVAIENGHAIIDFSARAESSNVSNQLITPFGEDVEASSDQWVARIPTGLEACLKRCEMVADPDEFLNCLDDCWRIYGAPTDQ